MRAVLLAVCALSALAAHAQSPEEVAQPVVSPGDGWRYERTSRMTSAKRGRSLTVEQVTPDAIVGNSGRSKHTFTRDWNEVKNESGSETTTLRPSTAVFQFPLQVAKRWQGKYVVTKGTNQRRASSKSVVERVESVTVAAGTFSAFKVRVETFQETGKAGRPNRIVESYWYAPEVQRWVKREFKLVNFKSANTIVIDEYVEELVDFKVAAATPASPVDDARQSSRTD